MNIKRAKEEIEHTVKAYLAKDTMGEYAICLLYTSDAADE